MHTPVAWRNTQTSASTTSSTSNYITMNIYLLTWNLARNLVDPRQLAVDFFRAAATNNNSSSSSSSSSSTPVLPDVIVLSLQEIAPIAYAFLGGHQLDPYLSRIVETLPLAAQHHGAAPDLYRHVLTETLGLTAIMVFATPAAADRIASIQTAGVGVGLWDMGNKGAVGVRMALRRPELELTFVAAHLAPMEAAVARRNADWEAIARNLVFEDSDDGEDSDDDDDKQHGIYSPTARVFVAGDLNYRTRDAPPSPTDHHTFPQADAPPDSPRHHSLWLKGDQLARERAAGRVLHGFDEEPVTFAPTYKISSRGGWAKHRFPSWCDRILFLEGSGADVHAYTSLPALPSSDHAPVAMSLSLNPKLPQSDPSHPRNRPPFPLNPDWRQRREAARRKEVVVGVLAWLGLTWEGNAVVVAVIVGWAAVYGVWYR